MRQRVQLASQVYAYLTKSGYVEVSGRREATRSIAVGPEGRWICLYDSAGNGDDADPTAFESLALHLSQVAPVVDIHMSDSAALQMLFYRSGRQVDQVADSLGIGHAWGSYEQRGEYQGNPEEWADVLIDRRQAPFLRHAWQENDSNRMLAETASILGWHPLLCAVGYTIDYDGVPVYYKDHLKGEPVDTSVFVEHHYRVTGR